MIFHFIKQNERVRSAKIRCRKKPKKRDLIQLFTISSSPEVLNVNCIFSELFCGYIDRELAWYVHK